MSGGDTAKGRVCHLGMGSSIHVQRWANYFAGNGWDTHLITFEPAGQDKLHNKVTQHVLKRAHIPWLGYFIASGRVFKLIRQLNPLIIHAHSLDGYGIFTIKPKKGTRPIPVILTAWGYHHIKNHKGMKRGMEAKAISSADFITSQDAGLKKAILEAFDFPEERFHVFHWGIDLDRFRTGYADQVKKLGDELGISDDVRVIMSTREINPYYNIASIILSIPHVLKKNPRCKFVFLKGPGKDVYARKMEKLAASLGVSGNVHFVKKFLGYDEIPVYLNLADVVLMLPYTDQASMSLAEALACGNIVLVSDLKGNREWIEDGTNGFLIKLNKPKELELNKVLLNDTMTEDEKKIAEASVPSQRLADKILLCLDSLDKKAAIAGKNRSLVEERADWSKGAGRMEELYFELIGRYGR